jgi:hypothetical protein
VPPDQRDLEAIHSLARALHKTIHAEIPAGDQYLPQIPPLLEQGSDVRNAAIHLCELTRHVHQVVAKEHTDVSKRTVDLFTEDQYMDTSVTLRQVYKELHESLMTMVTLLQNGKRITVDEETLARLYIDQRALVQAIENKILEEGDV